MAYNASMTASELVPTYHAQITGKTILTTGASPGGLGSQFVEAIASAQPALLILAGRNPAKLQETANTIAAIQPRVAVRMLTVDFESLSSVRDAAAVVDGERGPCYRCIDEQ